MRQLASIKKIASISPIEGKDRIALAKVDGWSVIVQKSDFDVGSLCVFCEIDSVLPERPEFEFLRGRGFHIKTMKMAGCLSQGICFPLSILPPSRHGYHEGQDVTEILGVTQWEPTIDKDPNTKGGEKYPKWLMRQRWFRSLVLPRKKRKGGFPAFISKTDETRIQNVPYVLADKKEYIATEKVDGQSGTFALVRRHRPWPFRDKYEYIVCSRNMRLTERDNSSYWAVSDRYKVEAALRNLIGDRDWIAIQGECVGPKIQGNKYRLDEFRLYVFNLIYSDLGRVGSLRAKQTVESKGMEFVPVVSEHYVLPDTMDEALADSTGKSAILPETLREGIVIRTPDGRESWKIVSPDFLIYYNE